jgi:2-polyprenyl-6-methoxyphenol hydroxylase-like FAD-dependent oxidoreductase
MKILVIGAGIAGLTVAARLSGRGRRVVVLEREGAVRTEGYMIDFFGPGFDVAERMGLLPALARAHYPVTRLVFVDGRSRPRAVIDYPRIRRSVFRDRHFNFMRGDLERVLHDMLPPAVELRFGTTARAIDLEADGAAVATSDGRRERYDVVVAADGARSATRELVMPPAAIRHRYLGCHTAAAILPSVPPQLDRDALVTMADADVSVAAYPIRGGRTAAFFLYRAPRPVDDRSAATCRRELEASFRGRGWITDQLLDALSGQDAAYFDDVTQVELASWSRGRVVFIGDACGAVSLVAGQGASMAMGGAYVLAEELVHGQGSIDQALACYEARLRPPVESRQKRARRNVSWFLPRSHLGAVLRDRATDLFLRSPLAPVLGRRLGAASLELD